jgi:hypothetical protein
MAHKILWICVILLIFIDAGMTYWAITAGEAQEANPIVVEVIESYNLEIAIALSVIIRVAVSGVAIVVFEYFDRHILKLVPAVVLLLVSAAPVIWNIAILL